MDTENRRLASIVFTDIVGFTKLTAENEPLAVQLIKTQRATLKPIVEKFNGEWLKEIGDGLLLAFNTSKDAVDCSIEIQHTIEHVANLNLRIGIHQGEVIQQGNDILGDDVNVTSRIEPFASPGGIVVTEQINASLIRDPVYQTKFVGEPELKGVRQLIRIYAITSHGLPQAIEILNDVKSESKNHKKKIVASTQNKLSPYVLSVVSVITFLLLSFFIFKNKISNSLSSPKFSHNSIAVLPFDNYSSAEEDQFFSDGLTEVIIANLAKINVLKVISRTSVMRYKGTTKPLKEIGKELGVAHILEGSVQRGKDRIRIVGQLIDTQTDEHIWAETYDSDITDLFDIQINVAKNIAEVLKVELSSEEIINLNKKPTENLEAWDYYLKGIEHKSKSYSKEDNELAQFFFEKAVESDPEFAEAFAILSIHHIFLYWSGYDRTDLRKELSKTALDKAINLDLEKPEVRIARGFYYYHGFRDYLRALEDFEYARKKSPGNKFYDGHIAAIQRRLGRIGNAIKNFESAFRYDPKNPFAALEVASSYLYNYDFENAEIYNKKTIMLAPDVDLYYRDLAELYYWMGKTDEALAIIDNGLKLLKSDNLLFAKAWLETVVRNYEESLETLNSIDLNIYIKQTEFTPIETFYGINFMHLGQMDKAFDYFNKSKVILENAIEKTPKDIRIHLEYAIVLAYLGIKQEALKTCEFATSIISIEKDAVIGTKHFITFTKVLTIIGEFNRAIENLELMRTIPAGPTLESLKVDPVWDPLRNIPNFKSLLNKEYGKIS